MTPDAPLLAHAAATLAMTGVIWFVQLVHYPLFRLADRQRFVDFAHAHQRRTSWVVVPLMVAEAASAATLLMADRGRPLLWLGGGLLVLIWLSTAFVQVPLHRRLARGFDAEAAHRLVTTNWLRTLAWTARAPLALLLLRSAPGN